MKLKRAQKRILKAAILAYRNGRKPYLKDHVQKKSNLRNKGFQEEHPFMDRISQWAKTQDNFSATDALIGSRCRTEENLKSSDAKEVANCLRALGYRKKQQRVDGGRPYLWSKSPMTPKTTKM